MANAQDNISLKVEVPSVSVLNGLVNLIWYHNGSAINPTLATQYTIHNMNRTLIITNFTSAEAGMYVIQFNQLFVHPYNEQCNEELISLLRHYPVLSPSVFCVNLAEEHCPKVALPGLERRQISVTLTDSVLEGTLNTITIVATGTVLNSKELRYSSIQWYRNGQRISTSALTSLSPLKENQNTLSISQELKISNLTYEYSGNVEVLLVINILAYTRENIQCRPYRAWFISTMSYRSWRRRQNSIILAQTHVDIGYYKGEF